MPPCIQAMALCPEVAIELNDVPSKIEEAFGTAAEPGCPGARVESTVVITEPTTGTLSFDQVFVQATLLIDSESMATIVIDASEPLTRSSDERVYYLFVVEYKSDDKAGTRQWRLRENGSLVRLDSTANAQLQPFHDLKYSEQLRLLGL